jgi:hypothetical protein
MPRRRHVAQPSPAIRGDAESLDPSAAIADLYWIAYWIDRLSAEVGGWSQRRRTDFLLSPLDFTFSRPGTHMIARNPRRKSWEVHSRSADTPLALGGTHTRGQRTPCTQRREPSGVTPVHTAVTRRGLEFRSWRTGRAQLAEPNSRSFARYAHTTRDRWRVAPAHTRRRPTAQTDSSADPPAISRERVPGSTTTAHASAPEAKCRRPEPRCPKSNHQRRDVG